MASLNWISLGLSTRIISLSKAVTDLQASLPASLFDDEAARSKFEVLKSEIVALKSNVVPLDKVHKDATQSPAVKKLAHRANATLWDELPLSSILSALDAKIEELTDADNDGAHTEDLYIALYKFLQLSPDSNGGPNSRHVRLQKRLLHLERTLSSGNGHGLGTSSARANGGIPAPASAFMPLRQSENFNGTIAPIVIAPTPTNDRKKMPKNHLVGPKTEKTSPKMRFHLNNS